MLKRVTAFLSAVVFLCSVSVPVFARDTIDLTREGSIRVTMHSGEHKVGGGTMTLYRVAEVVEATGDDSFAWTNDFADCGESLTDLNSAWLAERLKTFIEREKKTGDTIEITEEGVALFPNLRPGVYLLVQDEPAPGYHCVDAFVVSVPVMYGGVYCYDVEASPKIEMENVPTSTPAPTSTPDSTLPQTGQLNWPIPVLSGCGLVLCTVGWVLRRDRKKDENAE